MRSVGWSGKGTWFLLTLVILQWAEGGASQSPGDVKVSSFEALDALIAIYSNKQRYPSLGRLILVGHSLGAQMVQRYSILGNPCTWDGVRLSYIVMNPSTYCYLHYDFEYKYGLLGVDKALSHYPPALVPLETLWHRLKSRDIVYLLGAKDGGVGDDRPTAMSQGSDRRKRYQAWLIFLQTHGLTITDTAFTVAGVGHDAELM